MTYNLDERTSILFDYLYNSNTSNKYNVKHIKIGKIELEDICKKYSNKKEDIDSFIKIYNFLFINQEFKGKKINLDDDKSIKKLANKFFNAKKQFIPSVPGTVPDTMVDNILHIYYKYNKN